MAAANAPITVKDDNFMAAVNAPITVKEVFSLPSVGINQQFITSEHVTMQSDKYICVREAKPQRKYRYNLERKSPDSIIVIIDMSMPNLPMRTRSFTADSAIMNPNSKILALRDNGHATQGETNFPGTIRNRVQIFNLEMKEGLMKSHYFLEQILFWKWITPKMLGFVTKTSVYHWSIERANLLEPRPMRVFEQTVHENIIINYLCDPSEKWLVLIGTAPGAPERPQLVKGTMQLFSVNQQSSKVLEAHAACFAQYKVPGNETPSILLSYATKTLKAGQTTSKLHVIELGAPPGKPSFGNKQGDMFYPPDSADDFPIAMHMSHKNSMIYVITMFGLLFVYDLTTVSAVYRSRISADPIFLTTEASSVGGFYAVNERGQVLLATFDEQCSGPSEATGNAMESLQTTLPEIFVPPADSAPTRWKYDVFLIFMAMDSVGCHRFTALLQEKLQMEFKLFKCDESSLEKHDMNIWSLSSRLLMKIQESRFAMVVLSRNYPSSAFRLEVLKQIFDHMEDTSRILPIFYDVDPFDLRNQMWNYARALTVKEEFNEIQLEQWRNAIKMVADLPGWNLKQVGWPQKSVEQIVQFLCYKLIDPTLPKEDVEATGHAMESLEATESLETTPTKSLTSLHADEPKSQNEEVEATGNVIENLETSPPIPTSLHSDEPKSPNLEVAATGSAMESMETTHDPAPSQKYDVFLSFRGEDTRKGFLSHLYHELQNTRVIKTFKDDQQLKKGKAISSSLLTAIEESRFAIIVLSQNYASSTWCLDELAKIYKCMKDKDTILPIFYNVDPSDIRHQRKRFEEAFTVHKSEDKNRVNGWRDALKGVAGISGWDIKNYRTERELVEDIVKCVWTKVLEEPTEDFEAFGETRQAMDKVMEALKDDEATIIGVHGLRGVGKTTMVKHVGAQSQNNGLFDNVIMVAVSQNPDLQKIQVTLANFLGLKLEEETDIGRATRLKERMLREKKILIILDDLWEGIALASIGLPNYEDLRRHNCKLILTTRISNVCDSMQCHAKIHLNVLSKEDSWKFLMEKSGKSSLESTDSYNEARKVARKCDGLPNALKAAARALGDQYMEEWNKTIARAFGDSYLVKWNEETQLVNSKVDRDVFDSLASEAKSCLLLCYLFPEDYEIPIEDMLKYGIGKGMFRYDTIQEARDRAYSVVKYLKASRFLLDGTKKGCIRMQNEMRDVAMSVALSEEGNGILVKAGCELKDWPEDAHRGYSAISLMRNELRKLPENLVCAELQVLLLQCNVGICEIPDTCFQSSNTLRVFDLSFTSVSILPASFNLLSNLQALKLDCCKKLTDISILGRLSKLEILSMRKSPLKKFPKEIGHLTNLRMLDVTGGCFDTVPSKVISRLYRLEELYMKVEFGDWGSKVKGAVEETNAEFDELAGLSYLNILKVYISDAECLPRNVDFKLNWVEYDICISKDVAWDMVLNDHPSRNLTLDTTVKSLPDWFINVVTEKAENLEYIDCKDLSNILVEYNHGRLHRLKCLSLNGRHQKLEELMNTMTWVPDKPVFESLEKLHLLYLQSLKQICVGELPPGSLRSLKLLKVQTCRSLKNELLPSKLLQRLWSLEKIICVHMEGMTYVLAFDGLVPENDLLSNLKEMRLCSLFELVSIWNGPAPHAIFHNLQVLAICDCKKLKTLFTFDVAECLFQLEDLCIEHCPNLDRVIDPSESLNRKIVFPALKKLALINLPELKSFCTESGTNQIECPSLENFYVEKCPQFPKSGHHFGSNNQVHFNDQQHLSSLVKRWEEMHIQI